MSKTKFKLITLVALLAFSSVAFAQGSDSSEAADVNTGIATAKALGLGLEVGVRAGFRPNLLDMNYETAIRDADASATAYNQTNNAQSTKTYSSYTYDDMGSANGLSLGLDVSYTLPFLENILFVRSGFEYNQQVGGSSSKEEGTYATAGNTDNGASRIGTTDTLEKEQAMTAMYIPVLLGVQGSLGAAKIYGAAGVIYAAGSYKLTIKDSGTFHDAASTNDYEGEAKFSASGFGFRGALGIVVPITDQISLGFEMTRDFAQFSETVEGSADAQSGGANFATKKRDNDALSEATQRLNGSANATGQYLTDSTTKAAKGTAPIDLSGASFSFRVVYSL